MYQIILVYEDGTNNSIGFLSTYGDGRIAKFQDSDMTTRYMFADSDKYTTILRFPTKLIAKIACQRENVAALLKIYQDVAEKYGRRCTIQMKYFRL